jgi:hypothetical protein
MACTVRTIFDKDARVTLVKNRMAHEMDPVGFAATCEEEMSALKVLSTRDPTPRRVNHEPRALNSKTLTLKP